jgi:hypothetical protein
MGPSAPQPRLGSLAVESPGTADQVKPPRSSTATKRSQSATWRAAPLYRSGATPAAEASCFTTRSTPPLRLYSGILRRVSGSAQARTAGVPLSTKLAGLLGLAVAPSGSAHYPRLVAWQGPGTGSRARGDRAVDGDLDGEHSSCTEPMVDRRFPALEVRFSCQPVCEQSFARGPELAAPFGAASDLAGAGSPDAACRVLVVSVLPDNGSLRVHRRARIGGWTSYPSEY